MKYDLEDLLQETYAQKEKPTKEFCQSVICEMKEKEKKSFLVRLQGKQYKMILAAACMVLILLVGVTVKDGKKKASDFRAPFEEAAVDTETQAPTETNFPAYTDSGQHADGMPSKMEMPSSDNSFTQTQKTNGEGNKNATSPHAQSAKRTLQPGVTISPTKMPQIATMIPSVNAVNPKETPSAITPCPIKTPSPDNINPTDEYVSVCSLAVSAFSSDVLFPNEVVPGEDKKPVAGEFWDGLFDNRLIASYEELQSILQDAEKKAESEPENAGLQKMVGQLGHYDKEYFISNVLCINLFYLDAGCELKLVNVYVTGNGMDKGELNVRLQIVPGMSGEGEKRYYNCMVQIPRAVARKCDSICVDII